MRLIARFEEEARRNPELEFLQFLEVDGSAGWSCTYDAADLEASRRARLLRKLGVTRGEAIGILQPNSADWILWYLAALKIGAVSVALNPDLPVSELTTLVSDASVRLLLTDDPRAAIGRQVAANSPGVEAVLSPTGGDGVRNAGWLLADISSERHPHDPEIEGESGVAVIFSSGTTGARPKAVMVTDRQLVAGIGAYGVEAGIRSGDRIFQCTPIFHSCTLSWGISLTILAGASLILTDRFSASRHWQLMEDCDANVFWTMGSIIHILLQSPVSDTERRAVSRLRTIFAAGIGGKIDAALERWPDLRMIDGYGLSESPGTIAFDDSFEQKGPYPCIGRPVPSIVMRVVDPESGRECGPRETGEITIDLRNGFAGYLNNPEANREAIRNGIFHTGDLAYRDKEGRFYFVSRIKDIIRRGGQNISAGEVEQAVLQHPNIAEVAAVPVPDPVLEERVAVFCVLKDPEVALSLSQLQEFCEGRLAKYRIPEHLEVMAVEDIPRTATGKLAKFQLRQQLANAGNIQKSE